MKFTGGSVGNPTSLANLRPAWRAGQSGNPRGRRRGHKRPERRLLDLLADDATQGLGEQMLLEGLIAGHSWAWNLLLNPPPLPVLVRRDGESIEPITLELPGVAWWAYFADRLARVAAERPLAPPTALLRAVGAPWVPRRR